MQPSDVAFSEPSQPFALGREGNGGLVGRA
jgi:hypothetical protein